MIINHWQQQQRQKFIAGRKRLIKHWLLEIKLLHLEKSFYKCMQQPIFPKLNMEKLSASFIAGVGDTVINFLKHREIFKKFELALIGYSRQW